MSIHTCYHDSLKNIAVILTMHINISVTNDLFVLILLWDPQTRLELSRRVHEKSGITGRAQKENTVVKNRCEKVPILAHPGDYHLYRSDQRFVHEQIE